VNTAGGSHPVPSEQGAYQDYYTQFAAALAGTAPFPVPAGEAIHTLEVLDAARLSATEHRVVSLDENHPGEQKDP
jgi:predicted dehydrogenase